MCVCVSITGPLCLCTNPPTCQVRRQWKRNGKRDALWRCLVERDYPNTRILLYEAKLDGHFRDFYRKLDR